MASVQFHCPKLYLLIPKTTAWCSEIGSLTSRDARNSGASSDRRGPISLHQAVLEIEKEIVLEVARGEKPDLRKSTAQITNQHKAQIRKALVLFSGLICALRSVDFLR